MEKTTLNVEGMSCGHCVKAITEAVGALDGVTSVKVELSAKTVAVEYNPALVTLEKIKDEIIEAGFEII